MPKRLKKGRTWWVGRRGEGLRIRLKPIPGETHRKTLRHALFFPAVLRGFGWTEEFAFSNVQTINGGDFTQPTRGRSRRQLDETETLTLAYDPKWLVVNGIHPEEFHHALIRIGRSKEPVQLKARMEGARKPLLRMPVNLMSIAVALREQEPDTLYYLLRFEEWRPLDAERKGASRFPLNHFLDGNDTLHSLAKKYYRRTKHWHAIAERNHIRKWGQNTPLVKMKRYKLGDKIVIPPEPRAAKWLGPSPQSGSMIDEPPANDPSRLTDLTEH